MKTLNSDTQTPATVTAQPSPTRHVRVLRLNCTLLSITLIGVAVYAQMQKQRADEWRTEALHWQSVRTAPTTTYPASTPAPAVPTTAYYGVTLIGKDGSETPLTGKALRLDLGQQRLLEVDLQQKPSGYLFAWAPVKREEKYGHRLVFHPHCANAFSLELSRVSFKSTSSDLFLQQAP